VKWRRSEAYPPRRSEEFKKEIISHQKEVEGEPKVIIINSKEEQIILIEPWKYRGTRTEGDPIIPKEIRSLPKEMKGEPKNKEMNIVDESTQARKEILRCR
jgi:hypothetical protein